MYAATSFTRRKQVVDVKQQVILEEHKFSMNRQKYFCPLRRVIGLGSRFTFNFFWQLQCKMLGEGEKDTSTSNKETDANMRQSGDENHSTEQNVAKKFTVEKLKSAPEIGVPPAQNSDGSAESFGTSSGQFTYGYATNEAIPMTVFYRSQHSQGHSRKQRPTLQQLRKGFEKGFENGSVSQLYVLPHKVLQRVEL